MNCEDTVVFGVKRVACYCCCWLVRQRLGAMSYAAPGKLSDKTWGGRLNVEQKRENTRAMFIKKGFGGKNQTVFCFLFNHQIS